jgi:NitT/TauT family transport system substrate-binding protein
MPGRGEPPGSLTMSRVTSLVHIISIVATFALVGADSARAVEKVVTGVLGSYTSGVWPILIGMKKGFFAKRGIELDVVFVPSAPGLVQQLAAGSLDLVAVNGVVEPIHAVDKGAPVAILRIIGQTPNYALLAKPNIKSVKDLKGKTIAIGGLRDINRIYLDEMLLPNGLKEGDYDIIVIGATGARLAALKSGAIDATMLVPPASFEAQKLGFSNIGLVRDYAGDLPQTGMQISRRWAETRKKVVSDIVESVNEGVAWFYDIANRDEAIDIMTTAAKANRSEVAESYDFLSKIEFFARSGTVRRAPLIRMMNAMKGMKDIPSIIPAEKLVLVGVTEIED